MRPEGGYRRGRSLISSGIRDLFHEPLRVYGTLMGVGFVVASVLAYARQAYLNQAETFNGSVITLVPADPPGPLTGVPPEGLVGVHYFGDFLTSWIQSGFPNPYIPPPDNFVSNYLPFFTVFTLRPFTSTYGTAFVIVTVVATVSLFALFYRPLRNRGVPMTFLVTFLVVLASAPYLTVVDRGNVQLLVALFGVIFASLLVERRAYGAAAFLALSASIKGYPLIYVILLLRERWWRPAALSAVLLAATMALPFVWFAGSPVESLRNFLTVAGTFADPAGYRGNQSLVFFASALELRGQIEPIRAFARFTVANYSLVQVVVGLALVIGAALPRLTTRLEAALLLTVGIVMLPGLSYSYTGLMFLVPLMIAAKEVRSGDIASSVYLALVACVMMPKALVAGTLSLAETTQFLNVAAQLVLLATIAVVVIYRLARPNFGIGWAGGSRL